MLTTLICTLGQTAPVITETIRALETTRGVTINKLIIIHTHSPFVFNKKTKSGREIGLDALQEYMQSNKTYASVEIILIDLGVEDIITEDDNTNLMKILLGTFYREREAGNRVYVSIAGGRKTMSAIALFAAYLVGCDGIFHILVQGDEFQLTEEYGFDIPEEKLKLIEIPSVDMAPLLQSVLHQIDPLNEYNGNFHNYLDKGGNIKDVFERCNNELKLTINRNKLKDEYEQKKEIYLHMCRVVESIIRDRAKEAGLMRPQQESRVKAFESIMGKISRKKSNDPFNSIDDIAGTRVICYFREDVGVIDNIIQNGGDFTVLEHVQKDPEQYGYTASHYIVTLSSERTKLIEYKPLSGISCEIQLKTIFDHAWSQVEHRFRYKSDEYNRMNGEIKNQVDKVFIATNVYLEDTKNKFSQLRDIYKRLRKNDDYTSGT